MRAKNDFQRERSKMYVAIPVVFSGSLRYDCIAFMIKNVETEKTELKNPLVAMIYKKGFSVL